MKNFVVEENRLDKAKKIEAVLLDYTKEEVKNKKILDIGTGNGEIADYFVKNNEVYSVDILDQRKNKKSRVRFKKVKSEALQFKDRSFDIVISNHIIEHTPNQENHLREIKRVLKEKGICYLATPNRLFPKETHYKVWFIHYLPNEKFMSILKKKKKFEENIYPLSYFKIKNMLNKKFKVKEYTHKIIHHPIKYSFDQTPFRILPEFLLKKLNFISPTNIFVSEK